MSTTVETIPILIVDDDEVLGQVLSRVLTREGRTILSANSMGQALDLAKRHQPRLALLDLCLPDGDGMELARKLQLLYPEIPVILMTAYPVRLREHPELTDHFTRVLTKPLNLQELRQAVDQALTDGTPLARSRGRSLPVEALPARQGEPAIASVTVVTQAPPAEAVPSYHKWAGLVIAAAIVLLLILFVPPMLGLPGVQALWKEPEKKTIVEKRTALPVELVKAPEHTLSVPDDVLQSLGIRKGKIENIVPAAAPTEGRKLVMPGSTAQDDTRLSRVRIRFNAQVISIRKIRPYPNLPETTDLNIEREILTGDSVKEGETLAVLKSLEVANTKATLVNGWVQLYFDQDILDRYVAGSDVVPEILLLTAERNVRQDQTTIAGAITTLQTYGLSADDLKKLRAEADQLVQLRIKSKKDPAGKKEEEAAWTMKREEWTFIDVKAPRSGTLVERNISLKEYVADNTLPLFQIADVSQMVILANPAENDLPTLLKEKRDKKQLFWTVRTVGLPPEGVTTPISEISYFIDQNQHTAVIKGYIDNPKRELRAGQLATATLELLPPENTVEIPINALVEDGKQSIVFIQKEPAKAQFTMQRVIVTHRFNKTAYVLSDFSNLKAEKTTLTREEKQQGLLKPTPLKEGDRVITSGVLELKAALEDMESEGGK